MAKKEVGERKVAKLNKRTVDAAKADPDRQATILWDSEVKGFGLSISRRGVKSFVLNYREAGGRECRYTIGRFGAWTVETAREEARQRKAAVGRGEDPSPIAEPGGRQASRRPSPTLPLASSPSTTRKSLQAHDGMPKFFSGFTSFRRSVRGRWRM
jgi:hypothetical protein